MGGTIAHTAAFWPQSALRIPFKKTNQFQCSIKSFFVSIIVPSNL